MRAKNGFKICTGPCGKLKPLSAFTKGTSQIGGGKIACCRDCVAFKTKIRFLNKRQKELANLNFDDLEKISILAGRVTDREKMMLAIIEELSGIARKGV